jgi:hypothetical protein
MKNYWMISGAAIVIAVSITIGITEHYDKTKQDSAVMMQKQADAKDTSDLMKKTATPTPAPTPDAMMHEATPTPDAMHK